METILQKQGANYNKLVIEKNKENKYHLKFYDTSSNNYEPVLLRSKNNPNCFEYENSGELVDRITDLGQERVSELELSFEKEVDNATRIQVSSLIGKYTLRI